jgi:hypothetical protein
MNVLERRAFLSDVVGVYNRKVESINLPVIVETELTAVFQIWDWSYEGMIVNEEIREKIRIFLEASNGENRKC